MSKMRAMQVTHAGGPFELVEREIPEPGAGQVRIMVDACGICHSDAMTKDGTWPGIQYPRVPGPEIAGIVDARANRRTGHDPGLSAGARSGSLRPDDERQRRSYQGGLWGRRGRAG